MGQVLHGSAMATHAIRAAIQRSKASIQALSEHHAVNPKTVMTWKKRDVVHDAPMGPITALRETSVLFAALIGAGCVGVA